MTATVRVRLPSHLRRIVEVHGEILVVLERPATVAAVLDALETRYPALWGKLRDRDTTEGPGAPRFLAAHVELGPHLGAVLPACVTSGSEPFVVETVDG